MDLHKKNVTKFYFRTLTSSLQSNIFLTLENYEIIVTLYIVHKKYEFRQFLITRNFIIQL